MNSEEFQKIHEEVIAEIITEELKRIGLKQKEIEALKQKGQLWEYYSNFTRANK